MPEITEGAKLMNRIHAGEWRKAVPEVLNSVRTRVTAACEELIEVGARIRPLMVGEKRVGWIRGLHLTERKLLERWYGKGQEFVVEALLIATTFSREDLSLFTGREIHSLTKLVKDMSEYDLSLAPYINAFSTTSASEYLWYSKGKDASSFERKVVIMPDGSRIQLLAPSHHAKLWATLCSYRDQNKVRLDNAMNAAMIVRPWAGKSVESFANQLKAAIRDIQPDSPTAWEHVVDTAAVDVNDGWGHPDDSISGMLRELHGMIAGDKHEQVMDALMRQQIAAAEAESARVEKLHREPGVGQKEGMVILTPAQVREREKQLKKGRLKPVETDMPEGGPPIRDRVLKYK